MAKIDNPLIVVSGGGSTDLGGAYNIETTLNADGTQSLAITDADGDYTISKTLIERPSIMPVGFKLPDGLTKIGNYAFYNWGTLNNITIPNSVTNIGTYAFYYCTRLSRTSLPSSLTNIGDGAFYRCTRLAITHIPASVTNIGDGAFYECTNLSLTSLPSSMTSIGINAFYGCTNLALTHIPASVTNIGSGVFRNCTGLTSMTFDGQAPNILNSCFASCPNIMLYDFSNCTTIPTLYSVASLGHGVGCTIRVPLNLITDWQTSTNWSALTDVDWEGV